MEDISAQDRVDKIMFLQPPTNSVNVEIPICNIDLSREDYGINLDVVEKADIYRLQLKNANAPQSEQAESQIFYNQLKRQLDENENGSTQGLKRLRKSTIEIRRTLDHVSRYLHIGENSPDFDTDSNHQILIIMIAEMRTMNQTMNRRFDVVNQKLEKSDVLLRSQRNIGKNLFLGPGNVNPDSENAYRPVCDDNGIFPGESNDLQPIISLNQIETMNNRTLDSYLRFYGLGSCRLRTEKMIRLMRFLGINERQELTTTWGV